MPDAIGCPFYGKNGMFFEHFGLVDQGGNQCGLIFNAYSPCEMEIAGVRPDREKCVLVARFTKLLGEQR